jgi:hypothetical protein
MIVQLLNFGKIIKIIKIRYIFVPSQKFIKCLIFILNTCNLNIYIYVII